ncbi:MAG: hypothetical protein NC408_04140 [Candidatus Gastranaerophilales bacterium]|nr:hypothetical protein [Candidatus Gastranaerophilales bacterium]
MTFQINGSNGNYDSYMQYLEAPLVNDKHSTAPILDFSPTEEADANNIEALEKFADENDAYLSSLPPLEYEYRYMPEGTFDKKALLATAREEMGADELTVEEFEDRFVIDESMTAEPLDVNKDGKIDTSEYAANIVATDLLSKDTTDPIKADGVITPKGLNAILEYSQKSRAAAAADLYANIYRTYNLGE